MARRIVSDDEDEPSGPLEDRSNEMPSDEEGEGGDNSYQAASPHGRKRARVDQEGRAVKREGTIRRDSAPENRSSRSRTSTRRDETPQGDDAEEEGDGGDAEEEEDEKPPRPKFETQPRDKDGYVPGSIVRMKLTNFLTYDDAEFRPGPYLNMVLGPNGTGKSSIACAICLGLAFKPQLLGRASEITSFVKIGAKTDKGSIEIELKGPANKKNIIITRTFQATDKTNTFTINGKSATMKAVQEKVRELNVQVDNLCSFLPQDRVAEFAGLTPVQLLKATQQAAGDSQLTAWHETLIKSSGELKKTATSHAEIASKLAHERQANERIKVEVEKFEQRQRIQEEIAYWEAAGPYVEYSEAFNSHKDMKEGYRIAKAKLHELMGRNRPLAELEAHWKEEGKKLDAMYTVLVGKQKGIKERFNGTKDALKAYDTAEGDTDKAQNVLDQIEKDEKQRKVDIQRVTAQIADIEKKLASPPPEPEPEQDIQEEDDRVRKEALLITNAHQDATEATRRLVQEENMAKQAIQYAEQGLRNLTEIGSRRMEQLKRFDFSTFLVAQWLMNNQDKFQEEIFLPPCVSVSVPEARYQASVEACFGFAQMKMFVAQTKEDYNTFNTLVHTGDGIPNPETGKPCRVNVWFRPRVDVQAPPLKEEEIRQLGFDCYAIDKVKFPAGLDFFLKQDVGLHRTPIAVKEASVSPDRAMDRFATKAGYGTFIIGKSKFNVGRSNYGQRLPFMNSSVFQDARSFKITTASPAETEQAEKKLRHAQAEKDKIAERIQAQRESEQELNTRSKANQDAKAAVDKRRRAYQAVRGWKTKLDYDLGKARERLTGYLNAPSVAIARASAKRDYMKTLLERKRVLQSYNDIYASFMKAQEKLCATALLSIQAKANYDKLHALSNQQDMKTLRATEDVKRRKDEVEKSKQHLAGLLSRTKDSFDSLSEEVRVRFEATPPEEKNSWTSGFIHEQLENYRNDLEANLATNGHVVDQYKRRLETIKTLEENEERLKRSLEKTEQRTAKVRAKWYPALKDLVNGIGERFSAAFDRMGCAGQVRVTETEDYATWSLDILVKFRSSEKLQQLTAHRQSGGERSLTTILYLMSLTEYARAPFSLVDEINQGMDNRAERAVHDQLVEVTCRGDAGQYFLITPKLLPDLTYHKRMRILCINNGDWLPDERIGSLRSLVENYAKANGIA